jgi:hypothetical protein
LHNLNRPGIRRYFTPITGKSAVAESGQPSVVEPIKRSSMSLKAIDKFLRTRTASASGSQTTVNMAEFNGSLISPHNVEQLPYIEIIRVLLLTCHTIFG